MTTIRKKKSYLRGMASLLGGGGTKTNDATGETVQGSKLKMQSKSDKLSFLEFSMCLMGWSTVPGVF